jgi:hypothetical protein
VSRGHDSWVYQVSIDTCGTQVSGKSVTTGADSYWAREQCAWARLAELEAKPEYANWELQVEEAPVDLPLSRFNVGVCPRAYAMKQGWIGPEKEEVK